MAIRTYFGVVVFVLALTSLAVWATWITIQINYEPGLRNIVLPNALRSAALITLPLGTFAALMLRRATRLTDELGRLVSRDRLTDVATRDYFFARIEENPDGYGVSLMIDIDLFKQVNDTYGHLTGDKVIARVAGVVRKEVRQPDLVCRFGGEEFVVFLFDSDETAARTIAERIRKAVARENVADSGVTVSVSVSIGGSLKASVRDIDEAIRQADAALYRAKSLGRNRTVMAHERPEPEPARLN